MSTPTAFQYAIAGIGLVLNLISMIFSFLCLNPKLKVDDDVSPIYFGTIATQFKHSGQYQEYFEKNFGTEEQVTHELCKQVYVNSYVAYKKFQQVIYSLRYFAASLLFWGFLLLSLEGFGVKP
ncbi:MAG: Pycsar system effector family protein [Candidatus Desantisbacteria bacterium]